MSCIVVSDNYLATSKGLHIDCYDGSDHTVFTVTSNLAAEETDNITDIIISSDNKYLAAITSVSKQLVICELPLAKDSKSFVLPRSASKIRFTTNNTQVLVADKSGDVLIYKITSQEPGTKLSGHLSLLLDILQTNDEKYIITSDRDEKIRVYCYPNTYNIETYCLGHKEFVNHLELLPHSPKYLTSSSGDGTVKCWNYTNGNLVYSIDVYLDVDDNQLKESFTKMMDDEGVEVTTLPIVHYTATKISDNCSLLAVAIHSYNKLLIYSLETKNNQFIHKKEEQLVLEKFPTAVKFHKQFLYVYDDADTTVTIFKIVNTDNIITLEGDKKIKMFNTHALDIEVKSCIEAIKVLYKRKFDNVQQYHERKRQRIEKSSQ